MTTNPQSIITGFSAIPTLAHVDDGAPAEGLAVLLDEGDRMEQLERPEQFNSDYDGWRR